MSVIILSLQEGIFSHLFLFNPESLSFTRITSGDWDDIDPALSPDGRQLAYASTQDGFWDLYLMVLETREVTRITQTHEFEASPTWSPDSQFLAG